METNSSQSPKTHCIKLWPQFFFPIFTLAISLNFNLPGFCQTANDFKCDAAVISSSPDDTTGMDLLSQEIGTPCNSGCATGNFEYGEFAFDFGYTKRYACGFGPNNNPMFPNQHTFPCMRTTNRSGDRYWWWVDHAAALSSQTPGCSYPSSVPCQLLLSNPEMATVDYITSTLLMGTDTMFCFQWDGNPDNTWDPFE